MTAIKKNKNQNNQQNSGELEEGFVRISLVNQSVFVRKRKQCPLKDIDILDINYKNLLLLNKFLSERGKIIPSRITSVSLKKQRALANAIKRARNLALLSPIDKAIPSN